MAGTVEPVRFIGDEDRDLYHQAFGILGGWPGQSASVPRIPHRSRGTLRFAPATPRRRWIRRLPRSSGVTFEATLWSGSSDLTEPLSDRRRTLATDLLERFADEGGLVRLDPLAGD